MSSKAVFQVVDGGILRQIQLEKTSPAYRAIMAVFDAERQTQLRNRAIPSNPPAGRQEQSALELDDGSSSDASRSSLNVSDTTAMEGDEDEQLRRTPKQRKSKQKKRFTCVDCGYVGRDGYHLRRHLRTHTREKPYKCKVCDKAFADSGNYTKHERTHTGEKPYKCRACGKAFAESGTLSKHARTHTGEKPYKCKVCGKAFARSFTCWKHERTHTDEKALRVRSVRQGVESRRHRRARERTHEKPHECEVCSKNFSRVDRLRTHEKAQHPFARASRKAKSTAAKSRRTLEE